MPAKSRITLSDIARQTGVTRMAVSLALRDKVGVSGETRKRVLAVAGKLGYRPDPEIANLMARIRLKTAPKTKSCLALLTAGPVSEGSKRSITERKYVQGIISRAKEYGYRIEEFVIDGGTNAARIGNILWSRGIEGVIIRPLQYGLTDDASHSIHLDLCRISAVAISETLESPELDRSLHDQYTSMLKVLGELTALNYKRIGLVLEEELNVRVNGRWTAAYVQHPYRSGGKRLPPPLILPGPSQAAFGRWFDRYRPDVIVSVARFGIRLIEQRGLAVPGEIGYASLDLDGDMPEYEGLSGIDQNSHMVGAAAVDMLVGAIQRGQRGVPLHPVRIEVEGMWRHGTSTARQDRSKP